MEESRGRELSKYHKPYPFLGSLNVYEWVSDDCCVSSPPHKANARDCQHPTEIGNNFAKVEYFYHFSMVGLPVVPELPLVEKCGKTADLLDFSEKVLVE